MNVRKAASPPRYVITPDGRWIKEADMDDTSNDAEVIIDVELPPEDEPDEDEPGDRMESEP